MNLKKILQNTFVATVVCSCVLGEQQRILAQEIVPTKVTVQVVRNDTGEVISGLTADDFRLYQDGREQKILSVKRETRPLSVVIAFVTTPYRCSDGLGRDTFELATAFQKTLAANEDLAIVMTDKNGQIVRNFNSETASMRGDFSKAELLANGNAYSEEVIVNPNSGYEDVVFEIYPLPALQAAVTLLRDNAPRTNERVILFVNTLQNTNVGKSATGRTLLNDLIEEQVIVSRIGNGNAEKSFDLSNVPFGKRNFYLGITNFTGGESCGCPGQNPVLDLFRPRSKPSGVSLEDDLTAFLNRLRTRYHISYRSNDQNAKKLRSLRIELTNSVKKNKNVLLSYPKAVR